MLTPYYGGNPAYYDDDYDDDSDDGEAYYDFSEEDLLKSFYNMPFGFLQQILLDSYMSDDFESRLADRRSREPYDEYMYDEIYEQSDDLKSKLSDLVSQKVKNYEIIQWFLDKRLYFSNDMYSKISEVTKVADINKGIIKFKESVIKWSNDSNKKEYEWLEALAKFSLVFELVQRSQETDLIAIYILSQWFKVLVEHLQDVCSKKDCSILTRIQKEIEFGFYTTIENSPELLCKQNLINKINELLNQNKIVSKSIIETLENISGTYPFLTSLHFPEPDLELFIKKSSNYFPFIDKIRTIKENAVKQMKSFADFAEYINSKTKNYKKEDKTKFLEICTLLDEKVTNEKISFYDVECYMEDRFEKLQFLNYILSKNSQISDFMTKVTVVSSVNIPIRLIYLRILSSLNVLDFPHNFITVISRGEFLTKENSQKLTEKIVEKFEQNGFIQDYTIKFMKLFNYAKSKNYLHLLNMFLEKEINGLSDDRVDDTKLFDKMIKSEEERLKKIEEEKKKEEMRIKEAEIMHQKKIEEMRKEFERKEKERQEKEKREKELKEQRRQEMLLLKKQEEERLEKQRKQEMLLKQEEEKRKKLELEKQKQLEKERQLKEQKPLQPKSYPSFEEQIKSQIKPVPEKHQVQEKNDEKLEIKRLSSSQIQEPAPENYKYKNEAKPKEKLTIKIDTLKDLSQEFAQHAICFILCIPYIMEKPNPKYDLTYNKQELFDMFKEVNDKMEFDEKTEFEVYKIVRVEGTKLRISNKFNGKYFSYKYDADGYLLQYNKIKDNDHFVFEIGEPELLSFKLPKKVQHAANPDFDELIRIGERIVKLYNEKRAQKKKITPSTWKSLSNTKQPEQAKQVNQQQNDKFGVYRPVNQQQQIQSEISPNFSVYQPINPQQMAQANMQQMQQQMNVPQYGNFQQGDAFNFGVYQQMNYPQQNYQQQIPNYQQMNQQQYGNVQHVNQQPNNNKFGVYYPQQQQEQTNDKFGIYTPQKQQQNDKFGVYHPQQQIQQQQVQPQKQQQNDKFAVYHPQQMQQQQQEDKFAVYNPTKEQKQLKKHIKNDDRFGIWTPNQQPNTVPTQGFQMYQVPQQNTNTFYDKFGVWKPQKTPQFAEEQMTNFINKIKEGVSRDKISKLAKHTVINNNNNFHPFICKLNNEIKSNFTQIKVKTQPINSLHQTPFVFTVKTDNTIQNIHIVVNNDVYRDFISLRQEQNEILIEIKFDILPISEHFIDGLIVFETLSIPFLFDITKIDPTVYINVRDHPFFYNKQSNSVCLVSESIFNDTNIFIRTIDEKMKRIPHRVVIYGSPQPPSVEFDDDECETELSFKYNTQCTMTVFMSNSLYSNINIQYLVYERLFVFKFYNVLNQQFDCFDRVPIKRHHQRMCFFCSCVFEDEGDSLTFDINPSRHVFVRDIDRYENDFYFFDVDIDLEKGDDFFLEISIRSKSRTMKERTILVHLIEVDCDRDDIVINKNTLIDSKKFIRDSQAQYNVIRKQIQQGVSVFDVIRLTSQQIRPESIDVIRDSENREYDEEDESNKVAFDFGEESFVDQKLNDYQVPSFSYINSQNVVSSIKETIKVCSDLPFLAREYWRNSSHDSDVNEVLPLRFVSLFSVCSLLSQTLSKVDSSFDREIDDTTKQFHTSYSFMKMQTHIHEHHSTNSPLSSVFNLPEYKYFSDK